MKNRCVLLLFCLLFTVSAYTESPVHGPWIRSGVYNLWQNAGRPVYERGEGMPIEVTVDGKVYIGFVHPLLITNSQLAAFDSGIWEILFFEEIGGRIIYHLSSLLVENAIGTVTIVLVDEDIMYFELYQGDDNFVESIRIATLDFGREHLLRRIRVIRGDTLK